MRVLVRGEVCGTAMRGNKGQVSIAVDTSGRGNGVELTCWPDKETGVLPDLVGVFEAYKKGQAVEIACDVYVSNNGRLQIRPVC